MSKHVPNVLSPFGAPYATREERSAYAAGLRELAAWMETTRFPIPSLSLDSRYTSTIRVPSTWIDDESFVRRAGSATRLIGGKVDKRVEPYGTDFLLERHFGGGVKFTYSISRSAVCEARTVTVEEERYVAEDSEAEAELQRQREEIEERIRQLPVEKRIVPTTRTEYVCPDSLLAKPQ